MLEVASSGETAALIPNGNHQPAPSEINVKYSTGSKRLSVLCILFTELCERLTYYSIAGNLVLFLTNDLDFGSGEAVSIGLVFTGFCYLLTLFGGYCADSLIGFYNAIYLFGLIYIVGTSLLPVVAIDYSQWNEHMSLVSKRGFFLTGLILIAIGTGGIKANVSIFGAHQLEHEGEKAVQSFYNWFYWFINIGALIAYAGVSYIQQEIGFDIGYAIPTVSMFVSVVIFVIAKRFYLHKPAEGSLLVKTFKITAEGIKNKQQSIYKLKSCLDYAKISNGGSFSDQTVEDVKTFVQVIPIYMFLIVYWTLYHQMQGTYLLQAERMDLRLGELTIPAAGLNVFNTIGITIFVPLVDRLLYPCLDKYWKNPTPLVRMGIGMMLAAVSMLVAGVLEEFRKIEIENHGTFKQTVGDKTYDAAHMSVFWQIPQFVLIGLSEIFAAITGIEFAFKESPTSMKGLVMGINFFIVGLGSFLASLLIPLVNAFSSGNEWYPDEINNGYIENFFFFLAGLMVFNLLIFIIVSRSYVYKKDRQTDSDFYARYDALDTSSSGKVRFQT